jgi:hypothetical protein
VGAAELNAKLQSAKPAVVDVGNDVSALSEKAVALFALSKEKGFDDVAHLADGLRQQLEALRDKLTKSQERRQ